MSLFVFGPECSPATTSAAALQAMRDARSPAMKLDAPPPRPERSPSDHGVLVLLEAVNAGGKDGVLADAIEVLGADTVHVRRFRRPLGADRALDVLDVAREAAPGPGELMVFNRSYYGEAFHAAFEGVPVDDLCQRIVRFEAELLSEGVVVVKVFLHIDEREQLRRLERRRLEPELRCLHNPLDYRDQERWDDLMRAYDCVMSRTSTASNPWLVIPSNVRETRNEAFKALLFNAIEQPWRVAATPPHS